MTNEKLKEALYDKMLNEQEQYRSWLLGQPPNEILDGAYRYIIQEDILLSLENNDLTDEQATAMLYSSTPLSDIFNAFESIDDSDHMDHIWECVESQADSLIDLQKEKDRSPLYRETAAYAREHDELDAYRTSFRANVACKEAIEKAVIENYHDNRLDTSCVQEIVDRFGQERVEHVLAATVAFKSWDQRFSDSNRVWAVTHCIPEDDSGMGDRRSRIVVDQCHPGLTDLFITAFRKKLREAERSQEPPKRESVLAMLEQTVPARTTNKAHKPKAMER